METVNFMTLAGTWRMDFREARNKINQLGCCYSWPGEVKTTEAGSEEMIGDITPFYR